MINMYIYLLPKEIRKRILLDCYKELLSHGKTADEAKHEVSHVIACSRLSDVDGLVNPLDYI